MNGIELEPLLMEFLETIIRDIAEHSATRIVVCAGNDDGELIYNQYQCSISNLHQFSGLIDDQATLEYLQQNANELRAILDGEDEDEALPYLAEGGVSDAGTV